MPFSAAFMAREEKALAEFYRNHCEGLFYRTRANLEAKAKRERELQVKRAAFVLPDRFVWKAGDLILLEVKGDGDAGSC